MNKTRARLPAADAPTHGGHKKQDSSSGGRVSSSSSSVKRFGGGNDLSLLCLFLSSSHITSHLVLLIYFVYPLYYRENEHIIEPGKILFLKMFFR